MFRMRFGPSACQACSDRARKGNLPVMHTMSQLPMTSPLAGRQIAGTLPRLIAPSNPLRPVSANAERQPNWKLQKTKRLWELGETWYPGAEAPEYLDGTLAGDRGFDPLRLFQNPNARPWLVEAELYHGRIAMLAAAGIIAAEAVGQGPWWSAPSRVAWPLPYAAGVVAFHAVYASFELARYRNFQKFGETGVLNQVPFDPLNFRNDGSQQKEVRNGRLAMLANLGFWSQAATTGKGPLENLYDHIADPTHVTIFSNPKIGFEATVAAVFIGIVPIILELRKDLTPEDKRKDDAGYRPFPFL